MEETHGVNRRQLLGAAAGAAATAALLSPAVAPAKEAKRREREHLVPRQNIGIQMFTLRDMAGADLPATLQMLEDIGYPEIELNTLYGLTAPALRALTDEHSIRVMAAHVGVDRWRRELDVVLDEAETLGMIYVGLPGVFPPIPGDVASYRSLARDMNRWGEAAAKRGLRFYYHNHDWEFARESGRVLYDVLLDETDPDLVFFELDIYWIVTAGRDPLDYLGRYDQSRWPLFHCKDRTSGIGGTGGTFADLGEGIINFERIFRELDNKHYHHYFVERDTQVDPPRTARVGYEYLTGLTGRRRRKPYKPSEAGPDDAAAIAARRT